MKTLEATPLRNGKIWPLSLEAYHALGEAGLIPKNTELLYGLVYTKMSKSPIHAALVARLMRLAQKAAGESFFVRSEQPVSCIDSEPEPDISIVPGSETDYWGEHPCSAELAIEVCVTSHEYDSSKLRAYANAGVKECWLVLQPEKQIEIHSKPIAGQFTEQKVFRSGEKAVSQSVPEFIVDLDRLFTK